MGYFLLILFLIMGGLGGYMLSARKNVSPQRPISSERAPTNTDVAQLIQIVNSLNTSASQNAVEPAKIPESNQPVSVDPPSQLTGLEPDSSFDSTASVVWNNPPPSTHLVGGEFIEVISSGTHISSIEVSGVLHSKTRTTWMLKVDSKDAGVLEKIILERRRHIQIVVMPQN